VDESKQPGPEHAHNRVVEDTLIGELLLGDCVDEAIRSGLTPDDFYVLAYSLICSAVFDLFRCGSKVDLALVGDALARRQELSRVGGPGELARLAGNVVSSANVVQHARVVIDYANVRKSATGAIDDAQLEALAAAVVKSIEETGDVSLAFGEHCLRVAARAREKDHRVWERLSAVVRAAKRFTDWRKAVDRTTRTLRNEACRAARSSGLPAIVRSDLQLREVVAQTANALTLHNSRHHGLFVREGRIVRIVRRGPHPTIELVAPDALFGHFSTVADWYFVRKETLVPAKPDKDVARILAEDCPPELPPLKRVVSAPYFEADGTLVNKTGYDLEHAVYFAENGVVVDDVPAIPSSAEVRAAVDLLAVEVLGDFKFKSSADRTMAIALLITLLVRPMIVGCVPLFLVDATTPGAGKTLLLKLVSLIVLGRLIDVRTLPKDTDEFRKQILAILSTAPPLILFDNHATKRVLDNAELAAVLTCDRYSGRLLGFTKELDFPVEGVFALTANNPRLSMEIARRSVRVRIEPVEERPWERTKFRHQQIQSWVVEHRAELIRAIVVLVQNWIAKGRPCGTQTLGSYESFASIVGGILDAAGLEGFLENRESLYDGADAESETWREFTATWFGVHGSESQTVRDLRKLCDEQGLLGELLGDGQERSRDTRLGLHLRAQRGRIYGGLRIEQVEDSSKKGRTYRVVPITKESESAGNDETECDATSNATAGDVGDVATNVPPQRPPSQTIEAQEVARDGGRWGTFFGVPTRERKKEDDSAFSEHSPSTTEHVPQRPHSDGCVAPTVASSGDVAGADVSDVRILPPLPDSHPDFVNERVVHSGGADPKDNFAPLPRTVCPMCKGTRFFALPERLTWICGHCHPPADPTVMVWHDVMSEVRDD
jgi:hypothetical protein